MFSEEEVQKNNLFSQKNSSISFLTPKMLEIDESLSK